MLRTEILARLSQDKVRSQSLLEHSQNTANLCIKGSAFLDIPNILYILGYIHDLGKACTAFARKLNGENLSVDHSSCGAIWLLNLVLSKDKELNLSTFKNLVLQSMAVAVSCHHTGLSNLAEGYTSRLDELVSKSNKPYFKVNFDEMLINCQDELNEMKEIIKSADFDTECEKISKILLDAIKNEPYVKNGGKNLEFLQIYLGMFIRLIYSILIDADRTDAQNFDQGTIQTQNYNVEEIFSSIIDFLDNKTYPQNELNDIRAEIYQKCVEMSSQPTGLYELNVQTGGGKTLSGFRFALGNALANKLNKIIYVVPYLSIIEQNAEVIREILKKVNHLDAMIESHSNAVNYNEEDINNDFDKFFTTWNEPIIFTTMVSFLESVYCGKTQNNRRFHNLANSVIIFDEIQALPIKCIGLFNFLIKFLQNVLHCTILFCSATQPTLSSLGKYSQNKLEGEKLALPNAVKIIDKEFPALKRTNIVFEDNDIMDKAKVCDYILQKFENVQNLLVIVNTKRAAKEIFLELKNQAFCLHLSTNMCAQHRLDVIEKIKKLLATKQKFILISTQLIEAGVDLDFECVIRSRCGLDSIIQSAGRCNREGKLTDEQGNKRLGNVYVIKLSDELEYVRSLPEIENGQKNLQNCEMIYSDVTSKESIKEYFELAYKEISNLKYKFGNTTLVDELRGVDNSLKYGENAFTKLLMNFKTVADNFRVIDEKNTVSVLVPYGEGAELIKNIDKLNRKQAKLCQRFLVEVGCSKIPNYSSYDKKTGIWYAINGYDADIGLTEDIPMLEFEGGMSL